MSGTVSPGDCAIVRMALQGVYLVVYTLKMYLAPVVSYFATKKYYYNSRIRICRDGDDHVLGTVPSGPELMIMGYRSTKGSDAILCVLESH